MNKEKKNKASQKINRMLLALRGQWLNKDQIAALTGYSESTVTKAVHYLRRQKKVEHCAALDVYQAK